MNVKRIISGMLAAVLSVGMFAGCGKNKTADNSDKINITFSFWEPGTQHELEKGLKAVANMYSEIHPEVTIELISQPVSGYGEWIKAQMVADNLPDIQSNHAASLNEQFKAGVIVDLGDAMDENNPYNDNKPWKESFIDGRIDTAHNFTYTTIHNIPIFGTGLTMYYNKTMYEELGLEIPETWSQLLENCSKLAAADKTPIAFMAQKNDAVSWLSWELADGLFEKKFLGDKNINFNGDCSLDVKEIVKAVKEGYIDFENNEEMQEILEIYYEKLAEYLRYCPGASGFDEAAAKTLFLAGNAGHIYSGSWDMQGLCLDENISFEVGTFPFPKFEESDSPYAGIGMALANVQPAAITTAVEKQDGKKEAAIDFMRFLTSPKAYSEFIKYAVQLPVVQNVEADSAYEAFNRDGYPANGFFTTGSVKVGKSFVSVAQRMISGEKVTLDKALFADIQKSLEAYCDEYAEKEGLTKENDYKIPELVLIQGQYGLE